MTDTQDLIAQLRKDAHHHIDGQMAGLMDEAADAMEAAQGEIDRLKDIIRDALSNLNDLADLKNAEIERLKENTGALERLLHINHETNVMLAKKLDTALARLAEIEKQIASTAKRHWPYSC